MTATLLTGNALTLLRTLPAASVHCCITSPPYYGLRDYGTGTWEGGDPGCEHRRHIPQHDRSSSTLERPSGQHPYTPFHAMCGKCGARRIDQQIGLESTPSEFIARLVEVFREVRRVLRRDGVCFVNMGDSYATSPAGNFGGPKRGVGPFDTYRANIAQDSRSHAKPKDLLMMPFRLALALQADGWWIRSVMPWVKRSCMPESCTDRPTSAIEYVFMLTRSERYFWDAEAVRQGAIHAGRVVSYDGSQKNAGHQNRTYPGSGGARDIMVASARNFRNSDLFFASLAGPAGLLLDEAGDPLALDVNPAPFKESHFATFPPRLVAPLIKAGTSERGCCPTCGAAWVRVTERIGGKSRRDTPKTAQKVAAGLATAFSGYDDGSNGPVFTTIGWRPTCSCAPAEPVPCTALDPFSGAGTVALVADRLQRHSIGIELNQAYVEIARDRLRSDAPLLAEMEGAA